jgi:hypothetical protein
MRFRFTIRDLLWLTLVVAMAVGWWLDRSHLAASNKDLDHAFTNIIEWIAPEPKR